MKKSIFIVTAALMIVQAPMTVMAHGHGHGYGHHSVQARAYAQCDVEGCSLAGLHLHDGAYYCGHFVGDGHDYHEICSVEGCMEIVEHEHDGRICMPNCVDGGCSAGNYCAGSHCGGYCR